MRSYRNSEGYSDPTAGAALAKIIAEEHRAKRQARYRDSYVARHKKRRRKRRRRTHEPI